MQFTADHVWGLAVAADRMNGGYFKEPVYAQTLDVIEKQANKAMVKEWLIKGLNPATAEDVARGQEIRHFFNGLLLKELSGKINDFERQALKIAQMDEFTGRNMLEFAIISCLPAAMIREQQRKDLDHDIRNSTQLAGNPGDAVQGHVDIIKSNWSNTYGKYMVAGRLGESFVHFWSDKPYTGTVHIKAKIKKHRGDNTTQLNYVKKVG